MAWGVAIWAARGWDAHGWIRIGLRMRFRALLGHIGPRGVSSGPFSRFSDFSGGSPLAPYYSRCGVRPIKAPIPPVWAGGRAAGLFIIPRMHVTFFQDVHFSRKKRNCATPEAHGLLAWLALACLAYLASDRPRSPCLHQQQQQRRSAPPGRRRRPGCCCLGAGKASEADPRRGKPSMPRPAKQADPAPENLSQRPNRTIPKSWFWP